MSIDELNTFEYEVPQDGDGDGLPRIWWHNGSKDRKSPGSFYTRAEDWLGDLPAPWQADERFDNEAGWAANTLKIIPITYRSQAYMEVKEGERKRRQYRDKWEPGLNMRIHTEILCLVEGLDGAVVWSIKGMTGKAVTGKDGIFVQARKALVQPAEKALKKRVPLHAFWLPITQEMENGKLKVVTFPEGGHITPPSLALPKGEGRDLLNALYAGRELIEEAGRLRDEYEAWRLQRRGNEPVEEVAPLPVHHNGRNAPQALTADEYDPTEDADNVM